MDDQLLFDVKKSNTSYIRGRHRALPRGKVTVGRFQQNFSYPLRLKEDFYAERFKLLGIRSVPSKGKTMIANGPHTKV
uniref:Uncharacterized protein n=1 Tax=Romanomermis culicivorax TaxID=13658 RepID=A0A915L5E4_ROMCU